MNQSGCLGLLSLLFAIVACLMAGAEEKPLDRNALETAAKTIWKERVAQLAVERKEEFEKRTIVWNGKSMRWAEREFGTAPEGGHSLWISMHGGGGAPKEVNDQQWENQKRLYQPEEGYYVAPRAPTDNWNLWHEAHIDPMFDRLIEDYVVLRGVNPNRVYLMGYSAGGDGVWQPAPRMADRWAAAAMMAGHPNEASLLSLRNLPIALFVGGNDAAFKRNEVVKQRGEELDRLQKEDPNGYEHLLRVYPGLPHWMNRKDAEALPWMAQRTRNPWPKKIVWFQDDVTHTRFYWLRIPDGAAVKGSKLVAEVDGQTIRLSGDVPKGTTLRLSDALLDLDKPVTVLQDGKELFKGVVSRYSAAVRESLKERADPLSAAAALLPLGE